MVSTRQELSKDLPPKCSSMILKDFITTKIYTNFMKTSQHELNSNHNKFDCTDSNLGLQQHRNDTKLSFLEINSIRSGNTQSTQRGTGCSLHVPLTVQLQVAASRTCARCGRCRIGILCLLQFVRFPLQPQLDSHFFLRTLFAEYSKTLHISP